MNTFLKNHFYDILILISIIFIIFIVHKNLKTNKGTWAKNYIYLKNKAFWGNVMANRKFNPNTNKEHSFNISKGERECKLVLEDILKVPFKKVRPKFMFNEITKSNLELDLYNPNLKLACEYNGRQHYHFTPYFHKSKQHFYNQKYRDQIKRQLCLKNNIILIEVPYTIKINRIRDYLITELQKKNFL